MGILNERIAPTCICSLDIIVPIFNEEECFKEFLSRTRAALQKVSYDFNFIFVNDGSTDCSLQLIKETCTSLDNCYYVNLSRNFGKEAALAAGLHLCQSDAVVIIDADLQDPPELIPQMIAKLEKQQADVVYAKRRSREGENWVKKSTAFLFYKVFDSMSRFHVPHDTGDFRVLRKRVVVVLKTLNEHNLFMKGLFAWVGFKQVAFLYDRDARYKGSSKFNFWKLWSFAIDGITAFTTLPLKIATYTGGLFSLLAMSYGFFYLFKTLIFGDPVQGFPTLIVALSFFSGVQLMFLGVIGEYIARIVDEVKKRPLYVVDEAVGPEENNTVVCSCDAAKRAASEDCF